MSIFLETNLGSKLTSSPIAQIHPVSNDFLLFLDLDGKLFVRKENRHSIFHETAEDPITVFDAATGPKNTVDCIAVGTESGALEILNKSGSILKTVKDAHNGSIVSIRFSHDSQTIATAGEDSAVKLWSKTGMLRSELAVLESPVFALAWSLDNQSLALGGRRLITFKSVKPGVRDMTVFGSDSGVILLLEWSKQDNYMVSTGEDCRFMIWDGLGRQICKSSAFQRPFTHGFWCNFAPYVVLGNSFEVILANKTGDVLKKIRMDKMAFSLASSRINNNFFIGLSSGSIQKGFINLLNSIKYKNFDIHLEGKNTLRVCDVNSDFKEDIDFEEKQILNISTFNDHMLVLTETNCYLYNVRNFITPVIFEISKDPFLFSFLSSTSILIAHKSNQSSAQIYDFKGKLISNCKLPIQLLNKNLISLSYESLVLIDPANAKIVQFIDSSNGKQLSTYTHPNEISEVYLNHYNNQSQRKLLILDSNKDLYLYHIAKNTVRRIASLVNSCMWHEHMDIFVYTTFEKLVIVYSPNCIFIDPQLNALCNTQENIGIKNKVTDFNSNLLTLQNSQNVISAFSVNPLVSKLLSLLSDQKKELEQKIGQSTRLARLLKDKTVWAILASFCIENRDISTAEIALSELDCIEKVQFVGKINSIEVPELAQAKNLQMYNKVGEAEKVLLGKGYYYQTINMHLDYFDFVRALKIAQMGIKKKQELDWLVDYVILYRQRYLSEVGLEECHDEFSKLTAVRTMDEIKELKKTVK